VDLSLRTRTLLLFLAFILLPLGAVGVVAALGTRMAVETAVERAREELTSSRLPTEAESYSSATGTTASQAVSVEEILAPLDRVLVAYLTLVLLIGASATLGYRFVTRRIFDALDEFRGAVEQIGQGDLAPWLPPPGTDEMGWLSLSLGRMTERIGQMMQSMEQGGRLAVVGEMAAHMAHEVRTPLSSIKMNLQLLGRSVDRGLDPADAHVSIDTSLAEIARLEAAVTRMLEFGAPERGTRSRFHLHEVIEEAADLLRSAFEERRIVFHLDLAAESDWIWADRGRVKGVFLNLLVNARDAMPEGGGVAVETQLFLGTAGRQMVAVAVSDSGAGVSPALREEIFHPFFTTKSDGFGIGLPAALKTLREHGGDLYLSQRPDGGAGACFVALFPLAPPQTASESTSIRVDAMDPPRGRGWLKPSADTLRWMRIAHGPIYPKIPPTTERASTSRSTSSSML
jgi:signal transduction histidine kinase